MEWLRLTGICILAAGMVMLLRQMHPQIASLLTVVFGLMMIGALIPAAAEYIAAIRRLMQSIALDEEYGGVVFRALGIVLITQLASEACREMDAPGIASKAELCGRIALMGVALPVFISLTQMAVDVLR